MKNKFLFALLIINSVYAEPVSNIKPDQIRLLNDRISKIEESQKKEDLLLTNIAHADQIIQRHSTLFTAIGTYSTIVGIFIGIIGLLSTIATYLFGILPARETIKDLEKKLEDFLKKEKSKTIEGLIFDLTSDDPLKQNKSASKLSINQDYDFSPHNIRDLLDIVKIEKSNYIRSIIENIISIHPNKKTEEYYIEILKTKNQINQLYYPIKYFIISNTWDKNYKYVKDFILKSESIFNSYFNVLSTVINVNHEKAITLINDEELLNKFEINQLNSIKDFLQKNSTIDFQIVEERITKIINSKTIEQPEEPKLDSEKSKKDHETKINQIIKNQGLTLNKKGIVIDKFGSIIPITQIAYTIFGPAKVHNTIEIEGITILVEKIPKQNSFA